MPQEKIKSVFDCNIFLQAFISDKGTAAKCMRLVKEGLIELYISRDILNEVNDVLTRPEVQEKFSHATPEAVKAFIEYINEQATFIRLVKKHFEFSRDPKDEPYINLASEISADYIVTWDNDLLDLMAGFTDECKQFRQKFRPLKVIKPDDFLQVFAD